MKKNRLLITLLLPLLFGGFFPVNESNRSDIPVFVYHRFGDSRYPSTNISIADFEAHLKYLSENGFQVVTLGKALNMLDNNVNIPEKTVVITIDDGYRTFLTNGMPVLRKYGYKATLFVNTDASGSDLLNWDEIRALEKEGIEIGNHTHSHHYFLNNDDEDEILRVFREDLEKSKQIFIKELGYSPELFAYPYGEYNNAMKAELRKLGFKAAAAQNSGVLSKYSDRYAIPRFPSAGTYAALNKFIEKSKMRALPVKTAENYDLTDWKENPPELKLKLLEPGAIRTSSLNCFVGGTKACSITYDENTGIITVKADKPLTGRRTKYTVTAASTGKKPSWYWYSFLWINPDKK